MSFHPKMKTYKEKFFFPQCYFYIRYLFPSVFSIKIKKREEEESCEKKCRQSLSSFSLHYIINNQHSAFLEE